MLIFTAGKYLEKNKKGFTFFELLVVLLIIGMVSALVAPKLINGLSNVNIKTEINKIAASLRYARSLAISEKMKISFIFDFEGKKFCIFKTKLSFKDYNFADGILLKAAELNQKQFYTGLFTIDFYPNGSSSGGKLIFSNERDKYYLINVDFVTGIVSQDKIDTWKEKTTASL